MLSARGWCRRDSSRGRAAERAAGPQPPARGTLGWLMVPEAAGQTEAPVAAGPTGMPRG